jgi:hypothetical protein
MGKILRKAHGLTVGYGLEAQIARSPDHGFSGALGIDRLDELRCELNIGRNPMGRGNATGDLTHVVFDAFSVAQEIGCARPP